ncbi:MAG: DUF481 domain-containing protein [Bacteroidota bacterium]|nr:DUF481 domain-containing protein [Bacteroidota bacterium]
MKLRYPLRSASLILSALATVLLLLPATVSAQVNTEKLRRSEDARGFAFTTGVSLGLTRGNSEFVSVAGDLRVDYMRDDDRHFAVLDYAFKESSKGKIANKGFFHLRTIWDVATALAVEGFGQAEFNEFLSLANRDLLGAGLRWNAVRLQNAEEKSLFELHLGVGAMYEHEEYDTSPEDVVLDRVRSTNYITLQWTPSDIAAGSVIAYLQPLIEDAEDLRVMAEAAMEWKITGGLHFNVRTSWRYHSRPMTDVKRYDLEITNGIRLTLP